MPRVLRRRADPAGSTTEERPTGSPGLVRIGTLTRRSTDEEHQPYSIDMQDQRLGAYIQSQEGWELFRQYSDNMSGSRLDRPGLQRALADARLHRYDVLLVYRVDRLARSVRGLAQVLEELDRAGVVFRSATEPFDTGTPAGRMMVQMLGVFAEFERATIIERVVGGMERKAAKGGWNGGGVPLGYRVNSETGCLEVEPAQAPLVPIIFDLYLNKRLGARNVANWLNEHGYRTRSGKPWSFKLLFTILRNRVYVGQVPWRDGWHPAPHPPLVDIETFEAVQALLDERGEDRAKRRMSPSDYLLGGLIVCDGCGHHYIGTGARGRTQRYRYYTCYSRQWYGTATCAGERVSADQLDQAVLAALLRTFEDESLLEEAVAEYLARAEAARPQRQDQLSGVGADIRKSEDALERYFNAFESGKMSESACGSRIEALGERVRALRARHAELTAAVEEEQLTGPSPEELEALRARIRDAIEDGPIARRKAVLQELVAEVRVESRRVIRPTFRLPLRAVLTLSQMVGLGGLEPPAFPGPPFSIGLLRHRHRLGATAAIVSGASARARALHREAVSKLEVISA
jgi:site-specific DNA recombinase